MLDSSHACTFFTDRVPIHINSVRCIMEETQEATAEETVAPDAQNVMFTISNGIPYNTQLSPSQSGAVLTIGMDNGLQVMINLPMYSSQYGGPNGIQGIVVTSPSGSLTQNIYFQANSQQNCTAQGGLEVAPTQGPPIWISHNNDNWIGFPANKQNISVLTGQQWLILPRTGTPPPMLNGFDNVLTKITITFLSSSQAGVGRFTATYTSTANPNGNNPSMTITISTSEIGDPIPGDDE